MTDAAELLTLFKDYRLEAHKRLFDVIAELDHGQFRWQRVTLPSIAFPQHLGRWADFDREATGGEQIWTAGDLASKWASTRRNLGVAETGMGWVMPRRLPSPGRQRPGTGLRIPQPGLRRPRVASLSAADLARMTTGATGGNVTSGTCCWATSPTTTVTQV
jgi:hypothetical protein